jgi:putative membrane protein insertion efficiency factor
VTSRRLSVASSVVAAAIRLYQHVTANRPPTCRYWPTCSQYALEAVTGHGAARGGWLAGRRLLRCHPWGGSGVDPVPHGGRAA